MHILPGVRTTHQPQISLLPWETHSSSITCCEIAVKDYPRNENKMKLIELPGHKIIEEIEEADCFSFTRHEIFLGALSKAYKSGEYVAESVRKL